MRSAIATAHRFARRFNINTASPAAEPIDASSAPINANNLTQVYSLPKLSSNTQLKLEIVGYPPSALSVLVPPSLAVNIRRGSLMALQGNLTSVSMTPQLLSALKRMLYGMRNTRYTQVLSTETIQLLVSAKTELLFPRLFKTATPRSFATVALDGQSDWAILKRDALHVYGGPSLTVATHKIPQKISRAFAKSLNSLVRIETGLFSWLRPGYTFVGGRGVLGIVGNGLVYSVTVAEGEELAINKSCLVAISVDGPKDLQNCAVKYERNSVHIPTVISPPPRVAKIQTATDLLINMKHYAWVAAKAVKDAWLWFRRQISETSGFVKIVGPRKMLLQSGEPHNRYERTYHLPSLESFGVAAPIPGTPVPRVAADYLNNVTVGPKGVTIESTDSFVKK